MKIEEMDKKGFTLIEIIVTLLLVSITAALAGMWIVYVANGYVFAKTNVNTTQKAQLAMTRLVKEFGAISAVTAGNASVITYDRADAVSGLLTGQTISLNGDTLQLNGDTLTDNVSAFTLAYCNDVTDTVCSSTWTATNRLIEITLTLSGVDNVHSTFTRRVAPRNI